MRKYLVGAGLGQVAGGLIGVAVLPWGWFTILFGVCAVVGAYIAQDTYREYYGEGRNQTRG